MRTFKEYTFHRLVEDEMYTDKDVVDFMPADVRQKLSNINKTSYQNIINQVKQALNQSYQDYLARKGPSPDVDTIWRKVMGGGQQPAPQPQPMRGVARALGINRPVGSMSIQDVENSIKSYLKGIGSNAETGLVSNLDLETRREIENLRRNREIIPLRSASEGRMNGTGVHFFNSPQGLAFIVVGPGIRPMSKKFGT